MYQKILKERIDIENYLNKLSYKSVPIGSLCCHAINSMFITKTSFSLNKICLNWFWIMSRMLVGTFNKTALNKHIFLLSNNTERGNSQFKKLKVLMLKDNTTFITVNKLYNKASLVSYIKWFFAILPKIGQSVKIINSCNRKFTCFNWQQKATLFHVILMQTLKYEISIDILKKSKITNIVVDLDRAYLQAPIILAANNLNINTITFIHGIIFPPYLYVPAIANKVFCWGDFQKEFFKKFNKETTEYYITGNPAFKSINTNESVKKIQYKGEILQGDNKKIVTFISQNFPNNPQFLVMEMFCKALNQVNGDWIGIVKPHPADDLIKMKLILKEFPEIIVLEKEVTVMDTIDFSDLFIVVSSNFAFDAILASKPVVFWHLDDEKAGVANIFKENAKAIILNDEAELIAFLKKCSSSGIEQTTNLPGLIEFANEYCVYTDEVSAIEMRKNLLHFEN